VIVDCGWRNAEWQFKSETQLSHETLATEDTSLGGQCLKKTIHLPSVYNPKSAIDNRQPTAIPS
jgi:hypothetical protein